MMPSCNTVAEIIQIPDCSFMQFWLFKGFALLLVSVTYYYAKNPSIVSIHLI